MFSILLCCCHFTCDLLLDACGRSSKGHVSPKHIHVDNGWDLIIRVELDFGPADNTIATNSPHGSPQLQLNPLTTFTLIAAVPQSFFPLFSTLTKTVIQLPVIKSLSLPGRDVSPRLRDTQLSIRLHCFS